MRKWKPLIASMLVIAIALGGMAAWEFADSDRAASNGAQDNAATNREGPSTDDAGFEWETAELEALPPLDPLGLWPRDGQRVASAEFNVMWETSGRSECRLLVSTDRRTWYVMGHTSGSRHFLPLNFGDFESTLSFAVEFDDRGGRYRSKARTVSFGKGAHFPLLEHRFTVRGSDIQQFDVGIRGRDPSTLPSSAFLSGWFELDLGVGVLPGDVEEGGGTILFVLATPDKVESGALGWLEVYDAAANTYDRVLIHLGR